jgi:exodeoxyribonuclease VII large subunit
VPSRLRYDARMPASTPQRDVYTVSRLNAEVRGVLEGFPALWIEGEVSNLARPASGHLYFSLKDAGAQVRCAMWRNRAQALRAKLEDGQQVLVRARVGLYEPRGEFQLIVETVEPAGDGLLRQRFEALRALLAAEGLLDPARKRPLPPRPRRIGLITSPSGAALHDVLTTLRRRCPALEVTLYPSAVQGAQSVPALVAALEAACRRGDCDVLLLVRGGGSLEDLWSFNDERVARAIVACPIPVVTGVGHEVDVTIADLVADLRAPTPTGAAELVSPDGAELLRRASGLRQRLALAWAREHALRVERVRDRARRLALQHPGARIAQRGQRLDELEQRLTAAARLGLERRGARLGAALAGLNTLSPLATLARGYAIVSDAQGRLLRAASEVAVGDEVQARLGRGRLKARVTGREDESA